MNDDLILGIDGGGTKTVAWIAPVDDINSVLGRGTSGPSNPQAVGEQTAIDHLARSIEAACANSGLSRKRFAAACIGLAGADRESDQRMIRQWSERYQLTDRLQLVNDALPVLYAATPKGSGIALICGTGSFAFGRREDGTTARAGGWGYLFGDEGSAYRIALDGLRAAAQSADGRGSATSLLDSMLKELECETSEELITAVYDPSMTRARIATLCPIVFEAQQSGDAVAAAIIDNASNELVEMVAAVALRLQWANRGFPLAVTGGALLQQREFQDRLKPGLGSRGLPVDRVVPVPDPVVGALVISRQAASR